MYMDEHEELCDTGLVLGLNYDTKSTSPIDQKPLRKPDIATKFSTLERSSSSVASHEPSLTLGLFGDNKYELPKVMCLLGKVRQQVSPTQSTVSSFSNDDQPMLATKTDTDTNELDKLASQTSGGHDNDEVGNARKKLRLTKEQSVLLEHKFMEQSTLNPKQKQALAKQLNLRPRQVEVWFQNRRARTKLKQTQVDVEFLKRCCESLSDENKRLQKELQELRELKRSSAFTICSSCKRKISSHNPSVEMDIHKSVEGSIKAMQNKAHLIFNPFAHSTPC